MALVTGPLQSFDASGKLANSIVFSKWKGRNYVRRLAIPANPQSQSQLYVRAFFGFLSPAWASISAAIQAQWDALAQTQQIAPFNAYIQEGQNRAKQLDAPRQGPSVAAGTASVLGTLTLTPGVGQLSFSQAVTTANDGWGCAFMVRSASSPAGDLSFIRIIRPHDSTNPVTGVVRNLTAGTWWVQGISFSDGGTYGTAGTAQSAVVT